MKKCLILIFCLLSSYVFSQTNPSRSSNEILQYMQKLKVIGSVLYIAAHPDDENTRLLAYLANEKKLNTAYLSLTRGDGGQNLIGHEKGELLGLIRTQELLEARKIDRAQQFFTRAVDFGFSKNPEETFEKWNRDTVLLDVVHTIRRCKPDVIICRFPTTGEGGHGHHTASAMLAEEAFDSASDAHFFSGEIKSFKPWQAKRLFWNTFNFGSTNTTSPEQLQINVGKFNAAFGKYYGEIAAESRTMHKSQGFGSALQKGESIEYFKQIKGDTVQNDLFENIVLDWNRFKETKLLNAMVDSMVINFEPINPSLSVTSLIDFYTTLSNVKTKDENVQYWVNVKKQETQNLIIACAGISISAFTHDSVTTTGASLPVKAECIYTGNVTLEYGIDSAGKIMYKALQRDKIFTSSHVINIPKNTGYSDPYWLKLPQHHNLYQVQDTANIGLLQNRESLSKTFYLRINHLPFTITQAVMYKYVDPVRGELQQPVRILPPAMFIITAQVILFPDSEEKKIRISVIANKDDVKGKFIAPAIKGWKIAIDSPAFFINKKGEEATLEMRISKASQATDNVLPLYMQIGTDTIKKVFFPIYHAHIQPQFCLQDAHLQLINLNMKSVVKNIGYLPGSGDDVPRFLTEAGMNVEIIDNQKLEKDDLSKYDAIITGIRAYNVNDVLQAKYQKLHSYVQQGGNLVVQYNTNSFPGTLQEKISPYAFTISRNRVTDEQAEVSFLLPQHAILNYPNKITAQDFEGWVQERGLYFATDMDARFEKILSMHDKNEAAENGSLIVAKYGKGNYIYTGLAFFRQLPAGVSGAYKLLANMLNLPKNN